MSLLEFVQANISTDVEPIITAVMLGIIFIVVHDFYHVLCSAVLSWFKKEK